MLSQLETRSLRSRCQQGKLSSKALGKSPAASSFWGPKCYLICGCITPIPASDFTRPFSLHLCVFSFLVSIRTLVIGFRAHSNPG